MIHVSWHYVKKAVIHGCTSSMIHAYYGLHVSGHYVKKAFIHGCASSMIHAYYGLDMMELNQG